MQLTPVLSESVTVQQYLEAETLRQVQGIKVRQQLRHACSAPCMTCLVAVITHCVAQLQLQASVQDITWLNVLSQNFMMNAGNM